MNTILQCIEEAAEESVVEEIPPYIPGDFVNDSEVECAYKRAQEIFISGATFALQNQWISIEEELPPCHDDDVISDVSIGVIARTSEGVIRYAYYHHYLKQWFSAETSTRIDNVTKWMFVPEEGGEE